LTIKSLIFAAAVSATTMLGASAAEHEVKMLNSGETGRMVFEPAFLQIEPGDTVTFLATDPGHNAESIKDLIPEGATAFKGKLGETILVTFDVEGAYAYKCAPHVGMGMVGMIVVGDHPANLDAIAEARLPAKAKALFDGWIAEIAH
jgi:pseudoazurin